MGGILSDTLSEYHKNRVTDRERRFEYLIKRRAELIDILEQKYPEVLEYIRICKEIER